MTREEYIKLFHKEQLNLVAFKRLLDCDEEVLRLVNKAIEKEREECAKICDQYALEDENWSGGCAFAIRKRGKE